MCWSTKLKECLIPKIAEQDIKVFKMVYYVKDRITSPFYSFKYEIGQLYSSDKPLEINEEYFSPRIFNGFHSYNLACQIGTRFRKRLNVDAYNVLSQNSHELEIYANKKMARMVCIIPEGTEYYENENGEIVSEKLKTVSIEPIEY